MLVVFSPEHVHVALRFPCGYCSANEAVSDPRFEKPTFDGFFFFQKKRRRGYLEDGHGCWKRSWSVECSLGEGRIKFSFVGDWTKSWNDVVRVAGLERIISSHLSSLADERTEPTAQ